MEGGEPPIWGGTLSAAEQQRKIEQERAMIAQFQQRQQPQSFAPVPVQQVHPFTTPPRVSMSSVPVSPPVPTQASADLLDGLFAVNPSPSRVPEGFLPPPQGTGAGSALSIATSPDGPLLDIPEQRANEEYSSPFAPPHVGGGAVDLLGGEAGGSSGPGAQSVERAGMAETPPVGDQRARDMSEHARELLMTSSQLDAAMAYQKEMLKQAEGLNSRLWSIQKEIRTSEGKCGCPNRVEYSFEVQVARIDMAAFESLSSTMKALQEYNTRGLFMSMYEQTFAEMQLSRHVHEVVRELAQHDAELSNSAFVGACEAILEKLFSIITHPYKKISAHSQTLVRGLILLVGGVVLARLAKHTATAAAATPPPQPSPPPVDLLCLDSPVHASASASAGPLPDLRDDPVRIHAAFTVRAVEWLRDARGFAWGAALVQPTARELLEERLVPRVCNVSGSGDEAELLAYLAQLPFDAIDVAAMPHPAETLKECILDPLHKLLERCAAETPLPVKLIMLITHIVTMVACKYPALSQRCLMALLRTPQHVKTVCSSNVRLFPWPELSPEAQAACFGELYHLYDAPPLEYAATAEPSRLTHRTHYANHLLSSVQMVDVVNQVDSSVTLGMRFPLLMTFSELATCAEPAGPLQRLILQEMFYFAFALDKTRHKVVELLCSEAGRLVAAFCASCTPLVSTCVFAIGQNLPTLDVAAVMPLLNADIFRTWRMDGNSFNWLSYFFAHRTTTTEVDMERALDARSMDVLVHAYLAAPASVSFGSAVSEKGVAIGKQLFQVVPWERVSAHSRMIALLILISSSEFVNDPHWFISLLLSEQGRALVRFEGGEMAFMEKIIAGELLQRTRFPRELAVVQVLLACELAAPALHREDDPLGWLVRWGLRDRLAHLQSSGLASAITPLWRRVLEVVSACGKVPREIASLFYAFAEMSAAPDELACLLTDSLSEPMSARRHAMWHAMWQQLLVSELPDNAVACALFDRYMLGLYCAEPSFQQHSPTMQRALDLLSQKRVDGQRTEALALQGHGGTALGFLQAMQVQVPPVSAPNDQRNALALYKTLAMRLQHEYAAVIYWERFFALLCRLEEQGRDTRTIVPQAMRSSLNDHFLAVAKYYDAINKCVYRLYYSFTTWNKDVIGAATGAFFSESSEGLFESELELKVALRSILPPIYRPTIQSEDEDDHEGTGDSAAADTTASATSSEESAKAVIVDSVPERLSFLARAVPSRAASPPCCLAPSLVMFATLEQAVANANSFFAEMAQAIRQQAADVRSGWEVPIAQQLSLFLQAYKRQSAALADADVHFLELTRRFHINTEYIYQVRSPCSSGSACGRNAILDCRCNRVDPGVENVQEKIVQCRQGQAAEYQQLLLCSRTLAQTLMLLRESAAYVGMRSEREWQQCACELFFSLLPVVFGDSLPQQTAISNHVAQILVRLSAVPMVRTPRRQMQFLTEVLTYTHCATARARGGPVPPSTPTPAYGDGAVRASPHRPPPSPAHSLAMDSGSGGGGEGAGPQSSRVFVESRAVVLGLFSPSAFLEGHQRDEYFSSMRLIATATTNLTESELAVLCQKYDVEEVRRSIEAQPLSQRELDLIWSALPELVSNRALLVLASHVLRLLLHLGEHERVLSFLLLHNWSVGQLEHAGEFRRQFIASLEFGALSFEAAASLLQILTGCVPLPTEPMSTALSLVAKISLHTPSFSERLVEESIGGAFTPQGRLSESPCWNLVASFVQASVAVDLEECPPPVLIPSLIAMCYDIVLLCPSLIDRFIPLLMGNLMPAMHRNQAQMHPLSIYQPLCNYPWHQSAFLSADPLAAEKMRDALFLHPLSVVAMFRGLHWGALFAAAHDWDSEAVTRAAVPFLQLALTARVLQRDAVPSYVMRMLSGSQAKAGDAETKAAAGEAPEEAHGAAAEGVPVPWDRVEMRAFEATLDGSVLLQCVSSGWIVNGDPTEELVSASLLLRDVALACNHPSAWIACVREVRSLFFAVATLPDGLWYLGFKAHTSLLTSVISPLAHQLPCYAMTEVSVASTSTASAPAPDLISYESVTEADGAAEAADSAEAAAPEFDAQQLGTVGKEITLAILSCLSANCWPPPSMYVPTIFGSFSNAKAYPGMLDENGKLVTSPAVTEFVEKMRGLVLQFAAVASPPLALEILRLAPSATTDMSGRIRCRLFVELVEETLKNYFTHTTAERALEEAAKALKFDVTSTEEITKECCQTGCAFTLLVALEQRKAELKGLESEKWTHYAAKLMEGILSFTPRPRGEFYLFPLWFFILDTVSDERYLPATATKFGHQLLRYWEGMRENSFFGTKKEPHVVLASLAVQIYFYRILSDKRATPSPQATKMLEKEQAMLQAMRSKPEFQRFEAFFQESDNLMSPLLDIGSFKLSIIRTLAPTAELLLERLITSVDADALAF